MKILFAFILVFYSITSIAETDTLTAEQAKTLINKEVIVKANECIKKRGAIMPPA